MCGGGGGEACCEAMCFLNSLYGTLKVLWSSFGEYIESHGVPRQRGSWTQNSPSKQPFLPSVLHAGLPYLISIFTFKKLYIYNLVQSHPFIEEITT